MSRGFIYRERERAEHRQRCWNCVEREQQGEELVGWLFPSPQSFDPTLLKAKSTAALREMQKKTKILKCLPERNAKILKL